MKKQFSAIIIIMIIALLGGDVRGATIFNLVDISGSLVETEKLFQKNMLALNQTIEETNTGDTCTVKCFRSHGNLRTLAEITFPSRGGGRNRRVLAARTRLRLEISQSLRNATNDLHKMGDSTDCVGAINQSLLWLNDYPTHKKSVQINIYSDGLQTLGVGSLLNLKEVNPYKKRRRKINDYLIRLEQKLSSVSLLKPVRLDTLCWYGALYSDDLGLSSSDLASFEIRLRATWLTFLHRNFPNTEIVYKLNY